MNTAAKVRAPFAVPDVEARNASVMRAMQSLLDADIRSDDLRYLLDMGLWRYTEFDKNRHKFAIRYRSAAVLAAEPVEIQHEHVVPRRWLLDEIVKEPNKLEGLLSLAVACIVSKPEHELLRPVVAFGWERYREARIEVIDTLTMQPADLEQLAAAQRTLVETLNIKLPPREVIALDDVIAPASQLEPKLSFDVPSRPSVTAVDSATTRERLTYLHSLVLHSFEGLKNIGFGPLTIPSNPSNLLWARVPDGLWWLDYHQNPNVHSKVTNETISIRVHVYGFPGDRPRNEALFDILKAEIATDLVGALGPYVNINWRAAGPKGGNQVLELSTSGGVAANDPLRDAAWLVSTAGTWAAVMRRHPTNDLKTRVQQEWNDARQSDGSSLLIGKVKTFDRGAD